MRRIPDPGSELEDEGVPDHEGPLPEKVVTGDPQEGIEPPAEAPTHADNHGVTMEEQREGATINTRLAEEEPERAPTADPDAASADPYPTDPDERSGRIVAPGEGSQIDTEKDSVGYSVGTDAGAFSGEERAMHLDPEEER